jgi:hypothetical protein
VAQPTITDMTDSAITFLKNQFVGHEVFQPLTTWEDNTKTVNLPFGSVTAGNQIKAKGSAKVTSYQSHTGNLQRVTFDNFNIWIADLVVVFRYTSKTHGEMWYWPGGLFENNVWDDVHPQGDLVVHLTLQQSSGAIHLEVRVDPDHDDNPGHFIRDRVAIQTIAKLDAVLEQFTGISINS